MKTLLVVKKLLFVCLILSVSQSFALNNGIAILDLATLNGDHISSTNALEQAVKVAGIPYIITTDVPTATQYQMIVSSSYIADYPTTYLNATNSALLQNYVSNGGVWAATYVRLTPFTTTLFGIGTVTKATNRFKLVWQMGTGDKSLSYFTDPYEQTVPLDYDWSNPPMAILTRGYTLASSCQQAGTCRSLANFDDGSIAVVKNNYGAGATYALGVSYSDVIMNNLLNRDDDRAQRSYSNGFEPASDVFMLFIRAIYNDRTSYGVWKYTSMYNSGATVMLTHDVCSNARSLYMDNFASLEQTLGLPATYFVETHYKADNQNTNFYVNNFNNFQILASYPGVSVQSHSVSHGPDFNLTTAFPKGAPGNTKTSYQPFVHVTTDSSGNILNQYTTGGTVFGETEVSKNALQTDLGVAPVVAFRAGFMDFNLYQIEVMQALGYLYDSSDSANDILTNFPFYQKFEDQPDGATTNILEIPMTISDSGINSNMSATNYPGIVSGWENVTARDASYYAPTMLLIHPDALFKLSAEQSYINFLRTSPTNYYITDMVTFGNFWRARDATNFTPTVQGNVMSINFTTGMPVPSFGLVVSNGQALQSITATVAGTPIYFSQSNFGANDVLLYSFTQ